MQNSLGGELSDVKGLRSKRKSATHSHRASVCYGSSRFWQRVVLIKFEFSLYGVIHIDNSFLQFWCWMLEIKVLYGWVLVRATFQVVDFQFVVIFSHIEEQTGEATSLMALTRVLFSFKRVTP